MPHRPAKAQRCGMTQAPPWTCRTAWSRCRFERDRSEHCWHMPRLRARAATSRQYRTNRSISSGSSFSCTSTLQMRQTARSAQKLRRIPVNQPGLLFDLFKLQNSGAGCRLTSLRQIVSCKHLHPWCDEISSVKQSCCTQLFDSVKPRDPGVCGYG